MAPEKPQQQQQQQQQQQLQVVRSNHTVTTEDGWRLHLLHVAAARVAPTTGAPSNSPQRLFPIVLVPGLASSGTFSFDLAPDASLAEYLARQGWDVWIAELRGNGLSDKPALFSHRSHWFTVDDMVEKDIPAVLSHVCMVMGCSAAHVVGHSMGGMILTAAMARNDATTARMRSVCLVGSTCFLEGSWWQVIRPTIPAVRALYSVPAGSTLRLYSNLAFTRLAVQALDVLYFWPSNTDPVLARAVLARNFSSTSPAVILQLRSAFKPSGLRSAHEGHVPYADPERLGRVRTPILLIIGDKDKMCPWKGAARQFPLYGAEDKKLVVLGPRFGNATHYGHFDILMGKHAPTEVFPQFQAWFERHDHSLIKPSDIQGLSSTEQGTAEGAAAAAGGVADGAVVPHISTSPCRAPCMMVDAAGAPLQPVAGCGCADCTAQRGTGTPVLYACRL